MRVKIIEEETPQKAEYEINDFIEHCRKNDINILDISDHVTTDGEGYYCYTFVIKYCKND